MSGTNPVNKFVQSDFTSQDAATYKAAIDGAINMLKRIAATFSPSAQDTPDMTVLLGAGSLFVGGALVEQAAQSTGTITAPSSNNRIDMVYIDASTGAVGVATGVEDAVPSAPAVPSGKLPIATVSLTTATTAIQNTDITDVRAGYLFEDLGTAAYVDTGTDPGDVPLNSDLGTAAVLDSGTAIGEVLLVADVGGSPGLPAIDGSQLTGMGTGFPTVETFTSNGTFTVPSNVTLIKYTVVGGGGAGGCGYTNVTAGGGGSGAWAVGYLTVTPDEEITVTIGAGGTNAGNGSPGNPGGTSSLGSYVVMGGGGGGISSQTNGGYPGGAGGELTTIGGTRLMAGSNVGGNAMYTSTGTYYGGSGGSCPFGVVPVVSTTTGNTGSGYGVGGGGGNAYAGYGGGAGRPGVVIVEYFV